jgi:hypothetical protein
MEERDRFLTDFRVAWTGMKDQHGSVLDAGPSPEYIDCWYEIHGKESKKDLHATKAMLIEKAKAATQQKTELARTHSLIDEATTQWNTMLFERKQQLVKLIVQSAEMTMASPHILKSVIELKPPVEGRLVGYLYRKHGVRVAWTDEENMILRSVYAIKQRTEILQALPTRNWVNIVQQANTLGLSRPKMNT